MNNKLELEIVNKIKFYSKVLREKGFDIKLKFWNTVPLDMSGLDITSLKDVLYSNFYNVFETLLREGGSFTGYELESIAIMFGISVNELTDFLNNFIEISSKVINKNIKDRTLEENVDVKIIYIDLERFRVNILNYILQALMEMAQKLDNGILDEEVVQKYDNMFIIESLLFGGR